MIKKIFMIHWLVMGDPKNDFNVENYIIPLIQSSS